MRVLHVVNNSQQQDLIAPGVGPGERIAIMGAALHGERYDKVVDHTFWDHPSDAVFDRRREWWDDVVSCRIAPGGEIVRAS